MSSAPDSLRPTLSLIIPVHNAGDHFEACLKAIHSSTIPPNELIVVADGEPEETCILAKRYGAKVLRTSSPQGPAYARNMGAAAAHGDILFFVDADVLIKRDTVEKILFFFMDHSVYDALIGSYDDTPGEKNFLSQYKNMAHHYVHQHSNEEATTFWGACGAIRRDTFLDAGGFDASYRKPSIEDIEFGYRLKASEKRIFLNKSVQVTHLKRWQFGSLLRTEIFQRALPWSRLLLTMRRMPSDLNLSMSNRLSVLLVFLGLLLAAIGVVLPWGFFGVALCALLLVAIHRRFYLFFLSRKGVGFAACTLLWHWLSFLYGGTVFGWVYAGQSIRAVISRN